MNTRTAKLTRREFARTGAISTGLLLTGLGHVTSLFAAHARQTGTVGRKQLGTVDFLDGARAPLDAPLGDELDGRLYTDLARLDPQGQVTPTGKFYIRTRASKLLPDVKSWTVNVNGMVQSPSQLKIEDLRRAAKPAGLHLMECAGNVRFAHFGMISVAKWTGVPVTEMLKSAKPKAEARRVLISGFDQYEAKSASSVPGASWIFLPEELKAAGAFLALEMNGQPLHMDHGAPVRLVVPGWYGCTCIKWVDTITLVDNQAEATSQMQEYAARTHQQGVPALAREYQPAVIGQAAMPIRVEKWLVDGKIKYRVVGILWGGAQRIKVLTIRFNPEEDYVPVDHFEQPSNDPWSFWTHTWSPNSPGTYAIRLAVKEPAIQAIRMDSGYYVRSVEITEV